MPCNRDLIYQISVSEFYMRHSIASSVNEKSSMLAVQVLALFLCTDTYEGYFMMLDCCWHCVISYFNLFVVFFEGS
jgi:hypothetical protein